LPSVLLWPNCGQGERLRQLHACLVQSPARTAVWFARPLTQRAERVRKQTTCSRLKEVFRV